MRGREEEGSSLPVSGAADDFEQELLGLGAQRNLNYLNLNPPKSGFVLWVPFHSL